MSVESRRRARKKWKDNNRDKVNAEQNSRRARHRVILLPVPCESCHDLFQPKRADSRLCSECRRLQNNLRTREWYVAHPNKKFEDKLSRYGMTPEIYFGMLKRQNDCCAVCKKDNPQTSWGSWHIDHDHSCCGKGRSCGKCV